MTLANSLRKFDLTSKTALITGSAGLLGPQHAKALLDCGARVVITDVNEDSLYFEEQSLSEIYDSSCVISKKLDVTDKDSILFVLDELKSQNINVDILVNNAAIDPKVNVLESSLESSRLENFLLAQWNIEMTVGLTGAFLCSQVFGTDMARMGNGGVILNIASDLSVIAPDQRLYQVEGLPRHQQPVKPVTYSVIKSGLIGLTKYLATYWADSGVRCNALSPGGVFNDQEDTFVNRITPLIPLGRMAYKDEYISAIQFLCSSASSYLTGQNIVIDGGRSIL